MSIVIGWAIINLISLGKAADSILKENYRSILASENMVDALERQTIGILLILLDGNEKGILHIREIRNEFLQWLARAKDNITIKGEKELIQSIEISYNKFCEQYSKMTSSASMKTSQKKSILEDYYKWIYSLFFKIRSQCIKLRQLNEKTMYNASEKANQVAKWAIGSTIIVASTIFIITFFFSLVLSERIVQPIRQFREASRRISSGDYAFQIPVVTGDELGQLAGEFNEMAAQLKHFNEINIEKIISEKNKGEAIISSIEDGLIVFNIDLKVMNINPAALKIMDLTMSECKDRRCEDIFSSEDICNIIRDTIKTGIGPSIPDEHRIINITKGSNLRYYFYSITPIHGIDQSLSGVILLLKDVTRFKELEQLKNDFLLATSHELRTPLTSIGMSIALLLEHIALRLLPKDLELLQAADEEVHRMKELVSDLLDLYKIEAAKIELVFEDIKVENIIKHVQIIFKGQLETKDVKLSTELVENLPHIRADLNKITWVLTNLISNALRYVNKGGNIKIITARVKEYVQISVQDDGPGISPEDQSKIFQKFVQIKGRETGGTGLGLAICKEIVHAHGGDIRVDSSPGRGSTFTFTIPVAE